MRRVMHVVLALAAVAVFASAPAMAQDHSFRVFVTANWVSPNGDDDITIDSVTDAVQASDDWGFEGGFEWRTSKVIGIEGSYLVGSNDFELENVGEDQTLDTQALTAALNFHIIPNKFFDLWIAPIASWYSFDGIDNTDLDTSWGYGAQVGFDIGFGDLFALTGGVRYVKVDIGGEDLNQDFGYDPIIARVGVAFRFGKR